MLTRWTTVALLGIATYLVGVGCSTEEADAEASAAEAARIESSNDSLPGLAVGESKDEPK